MLRPRRFFGLLFGLLLCPAAAPVEKILCPKVIAVLSPRMGDPGVDVTDRRVEVRQCVLDSDKRIGLIQLVAWMEDAKEPSLIIETEERAVRQMAMTPEAYVFDMAGGSAARVFGIVYEDGKPRLAIRDSSRNKTTISSDGERITVETYDSDVKKNTYVLGVPLPR